MTERGSTRTRRPAAALVAEAAGAKLPSYVTRERARVLVNAAETDRDQFLLSHPCDRCQR
ncbi:MAG: hypothetical protein HY332_05575 [Chloroflexi bacterium]|nr:hypothetical protein [Chloroflexota bacterium]